MRLVCCMLLFFALTIQFVTLRRIAFIISLNKSLTAFIYEAQLSIGMFSRPCKSIFPSFYAIFLVPRFSGLPVRLLRYFCFYAISLLYSLAPFYLTFYLSRFFCSSLSSFKIRLVESLSTLCHLPRPMFNLKFSATTDVMLSCSPIIIVISKLLVNIECFAVNGICICSTSSFLHLIRVM